MTEGKSGDERGFTNKGVVMLRVFNLRIYEMYESNLFSTHSILNWSLARYGYQTIKPNISKDHTEVN